MNVVLGIDIGGSKINATCYNPVDLTIVKELIQVTEGNILEQVLKVIDDTLVNYQLLGIGIASAGRINVKTGEVVYVSDNLKNWQGTNVKKLIETNYNIPCVVDNDVNCAAYAEAKRNPNLQNFFFISLGTGVGGALVYQGKVVQGLNQATGELGHVVLHPQGLPCSCGKQGCIERYISGSALLNQLKTEQLISQPGKEEITRAFLDEDSKLKKQFIENLGLTLINIQNMLDPDGIIIGGGLADSSSYWWAPLLTYLEQESNLKINLGKAQLGNKSGALGAALLVHEEYS